LGEKIPAQCFGLGAERKSSEDTALNTEQCGAACCADKDCDLWQEIPGRGCFYGNKRDAWCGNASVVTTYHGGRKCIPGYCGEEVVERQILTAYNKTHNIEASWHM
jgi:hypothetical protein